MSKQYDDYLLEHKLNVQRAFHWIQENLPELLEQGMDYQWQIGYAHDGSKTDEEEYAAYDAYFYGNRSYAVVQEFNKAWLHHIHNNPHHWQHWVLINDDPNEGIVALDMPDSCIIEMICDWWSFGWKTGDLMAMFKWYGDRRDYIKISTRTRAKVESVLYLMENKLEGIKNDTGHL